MRIGTWNLAGRWSDAHLALARGLDCDVLLLTEVNERTALPGYSLHVGTALMAKRRRWAGVAARPTMRALPDPHPASAAAEVDGWTFCSSILPWRSAVDVGFWGEGNHAAKTARAVEVLGSALPSERLVWGGDFNHAMTGRERAGSTAGRASLLDVLARLHLQVATSEQPHHLDGLLSIDHVAVPAGLEIRAVARTRTSRLSDHDAYVVDAVLPRTTS